MLCKRVVLAAAVVLVCAALASAADSLPALGADKSKVSVGGFSSGAAMSVQMGCGASIPYYCAKGSAAYALTTCMKFPTTIPLADLQAQAKSYASSGKIDDLSNLSNSKVFLYSGSKDTVVSPDTVKKTEELYKMLGVSSVATHYTTPAEHAFINSRDTTNTNACGSLSEPFINHCDDGFVMADAALEEIYGKLAAPKTPAGTWSKFNQGEFASSSAYMTQDGYVYVPSGCAGKSGCKVHVLLHGCEQSVAYMGNEKLIHYSGYPEIAEANDIILLMPQVDKSSMYNPYGCWDWWGYTDASYATKDGQQISAILKMVERLTSS